MKYLNLHLKENLIDKLHFSRKIPPKSPHLLWLKRKEVSYFLD